MSAIPRALALAAARPWDFTIQYPAGRRYFRERFTARGARPDLARQVRGRGGAALLYVHVPFCAHRCTYCNFAVDVRDDETRTARYVDALVGELARAADAMAPTTRIAGIDVGGGTPTRLPLPLLRRLLRALRPFLDRCDRPRPLSVETTSEIAAAEPDKLRALVDGGATRLSMGVQSTAGPRLAAVGRPALGRPTLRAAVANARRAGFQRVNLDLIFGLPDQGAREWAADVDAATDVAPDAVTTYDCLYRGGGRALARRAPPPPPSTYGALYDLGRARLAEAGFGAPYGAVTFSRHVGETGTSAYFEGRLLDGLPYLGLGNGATSLVGRRWTWAEPGVARWTAAPVLADDYDLPTAEVMAKQALLMLSFGGLDDARFTARFGVGLESVYGERLQVAGRAGWLTGDHRLRPGRFDALPSLRALLYSADALEWLARAYSPGPPPTRYTAPAYSPTEVCAAGAPKTSSE